MSLTNPTNVVTEQRLAEFYQAIFPYLGGYGGTGEDYSTNERVIGTWIDGKPLYQKTFTNGTTSANTSTVSFIADTGENTVIRYFYGLIDGRRALNEHGSESTSQTWVATDHHRIANYASSASASSPVVVTAIYTKTTDTAGTKKYLGVPAVHYTTDEQVIGTWIDGKPLYQKTVNCGLISHDTTWHNVAHNISNLGICINIIAVASKSGENSFLINAYRPGQTEGIAVYCGTQNISYMNNWQDENKYTLYVTLQYTKTTD